MRLYCSNQGLIQNSIMGGGGGQNNLKHFYTSVPRIEYLDLRLSLTHILYCKMY